ncbi:MAG: 50S ribosomal protein L23 [Minisyncoccia bacterium]
MAIFTKTTKEVKVKKEGTALGERVYSLVRPHITEKAAILAEKGTYVFEVAKDTNKIEIAKAIQALYSVTPTRVNIINLPDTRVFVRNRKGVKSGLRKALVTLKKGDKIEIL